MNICAIDQSFTHTAINIFDLNSEEVIYSTVIKTLNKDKKTKKEYPIELRIKFILEELSKVLEKFDCQFVFLEGLSFNNRNSTSARNLAGLYYAMLLLFLDKQIEYYSFPPTSVKAFALKGNSSKEEMYDRLPDNVKELFSELNVKKTTGLLDLTDSYYIGKLGIKKVKEELIKEIEEL